MESRKQRSWSAAILLLLSGGAAAQQPGTPAYNSVFLPAHGVGDTVQPAWEDRWGAYASGKFDPRYGSSTTGVSFNRDTREAAEAEALRLCAQRGGIDCSIELTSHNTCFALAAGPERSHWSNNPVLKKGRRIALKGCGNECRILWEGCSLPVRRR